jgi:hypothetical protein
MRGKKITGKGAREVDRMGKRKYGLWFVAVSCATSPGMLLLR